MNGDVPKSLAEMLAMQAITRPHPRYAFEAYGKRQDCLVERSSLLNIIDDDWRYTLVKPREEYARARYADDLVA